jgi:hypothetical protein
MRPARPRRRFLDSAAAHVSWRATAALDTLGRRAPNIRLGAASRLWAPDRVTRIPASMRAQAGKTAAQIAAPVARWRVVSFEMIFRASRTGGIQTRQFAWGADRVSPSLGRISHILIFGKNSCTDVRRFCFCLILSAVPRAGGRGRRRGESVGAHGVAKER